MLRRLVYLLWASTAFLIAVTVILRCFSDIMPLASTEPQLVWRLEGAFLLTAAQWIGLAAVVIASGCFIAALLRKPEGRR